MFRSRLPAFAIAIAVLLQLTPSVAVRAVTEDDVPGVPLPQGGIIESTVGGPIVDRVYSLEVPAASVLVITLRGEPGAELGLYVFSSGISSILEALPLASSAKPGDAQAVSVRFIRASSVYLNVNGRNVERPYQFTLRASIITDTSPPVIRSAEAKTRSRSEEVCVRILATDPISGIVAVSVSDTAGGSSETWEEFSGVGRYCTHVAPGEGERTLYVRVKNGVDLQSRPFSVSTIIDDTVPTLKKFIPATNVVLTPRGSLTWTFSESVLPVGSVNATFKVYRQDSSEIPGTVTRNESKTEYAWTPTNRLLLGTVLMVGLGAVRDRAGNVLNFPDSRMVVRKRATSSQLLKFGSGASQRLIIITPNYLVGESVELQQKSTRGWVGFRTVYINSNRVVIRNLESVGQSVRILFAGSDSLAPSVSNSVNLN